MFKNFPSNLLSVNINDEEVIYEEKIQLKNNENCLNFTSIRFSSREKTFYYNISVEETFSCLCTIIMQFKVCYSSCKSCSLSAEFADDENHYCIGCKDNNYPFLENRTNCYDIAYINENQKNWFFDSNRSVFDLCHTSCKTCFGPTEENCLSCPSENDDSFFIYIMENV